MDMHPDYRYITYLKENNAKGINEIYSLYADSVKRYIIKNSGNAADAGDIFQEALIDLYHLSQKPSFKLTCPFEAFLVIICKRKWLNELKKRGRKQVTKLGDEVFTIKEQDEKEGEAYFDQINQENAIVALLNAMGERCQSIIKACMGQESQEEIAKRLGLSYAYLRKKKSHCMAELRKMANDHPLFKSRPLKT